MTHVVTESCIKCKYTDCVDVCPVDCFHEGPNMLVIDPDECIDCAVCIPECPVNAIYAEDDVPDDQKEFIALNAELAKVWPVITDTKDALPDGRGVQGRAREEAVPRALIAGKAALHAVTCHAMLKLASRPLLRRICTGATASSGSTAHFLDFLGTADAALRDRLAAARTAPDALDAKDESALILELAPHLERFLSQLFGIADEVLALARRHDEQRAALRGEAPVRAAPRRHQDQARRGPGARRRRPGARPAPRLRRTLRRAHLRAARHALARGRGGPRARTRPRDALRRVGAAHRRRTRARALRRAVQGAREDRSLPPARARGAVRAYTAPPPSGSSPSTCGAATASSSPIPAPSLVGALDQANYCIWCHTQGKDSCSKGLKEKPPADGRRRIVFKKSPFGVTLAGCPLEEKISEFHTLKTAGPGDRRARRDRDRQPDGRRHRPPHLQRLHEGLHLPEAGAGRHPAGRDAHAERRARAALGIRDLQPAHALESAQRPPAAAAARAAGYRVLVVGMGPAGFSLAHHLMNDGHAVVGIDGLKIEPLPADLAGVNADGSRAPFEPIRDAMSLYESLDERVMAGFGGVAEYGITVRWDKNFLKLVRLLLERRSEFALFGGVRFGGTLTLEDALARGLRPRRALHGRRQADHARHPERPRARRAHRLGLPDGAAAHRRGQARFDRQHAVAPAGGGDRRRAHRDRHRDRVARLLRGAGREIPRALRGARRRRGEDAVRDRWNAEEREIAEEFLSHARAIRSERRKAAAEGRAPRIIELLRHWGGVTIAYRRRLIDSPSYTLNHEEVEKALEEGIVFAEGLSPLAVEVDDYGAASGIRFTRQALGDDGKWQSAGELRLPACTVFVAAGTQPNTVLAREDAAHFPLDGKYFRACDEDGNPVKPEYSLSKPARADVLLSRLPDGRFVSFFGDLHPSFFGNVVKALGSTKQGYPGRSRACSRSARRRAPSRTPRSSRRLDATCARPCTR